jgi:N-acetylmuramoyl-L-alanine amidase
VPAFFIPPIEQLPADFWTDRAGQEIVAIVVHGTGGTDSRHTLQHGDGRSVSIHRLITKPGKIYAMVDDARGANHAGAWSSSFTLNGTTYTGSRVNKATLGIELENLQDGRDPYTDPQLAALGWQIADWRRQYGPLPILRHADLDPTRRRDPYQLSVNEMERWAAKYATPPDPFTRWGHIGKPTGVAAGFAVPRAWLVNQKLGACVMAETYSPSGKYSVTEFESGIITYFKTRNTTVVEMF